MSQVEKVSIALSPELLRAVKDAVGSGAYGSASEVVREALREWQLRKPLREAEVERLRKAWQDGIESGPMSPLDMDEIKRKLHARLGKLRTEGAE